MLNKKKIGFMQGRLCDLVDGKIQAFPWLDWQSEFETASAMSFQLMEWTLDQHKLYSNPLLTSAGQDEIKKLCHLYKISIPSLTGDCFMQAPFWKVRDALRASLQKDFLSVASACASIGIGMMVVPLVDNGCLETLHQEDILIQFLKEQEPFFVKNNLKVIFEIDYLPHEVARFISRLPFKTFGINYDVGNSAALGFNPSDEFAAYGSRVFNVHIKDRVYGGSTVPLGRGCANFGAVFTALVDKKYKGNFILQTARSSEGKHAEVLQNYFDMTANWINQYGLAN